MTALTIQVNRQRDQFLDHWVGEGGGDRMDNDVSYAKKDWGDHELKWVGNE